MSGLVIAAEAGTMIKKVLLGVLLFALSGSAVAASENPTVFLPIIQNHPIPPMENPNLIVFTSDRDGDDEIYTMNQDGSNVVRLTHSPGRDWAAEWSPDWSRITYFSERDGNEEIYAMNADGSGVVRLTNNPAHDNYPDWSPDGTQIVFASDREGNYSLYIMDADGSGISRVGSFLGVTPSWSPDAERIAFWGLNDIYVVNVNGSGLTNLTQVGLRDYFPCWSPDGTLIAFDGYDRGRDVFVIPSDGGDANRLTYNNQIIFGSPSWRSDGQKLAFAQGVQSPWSPEILTVDYPTGAISRLTNDSYFDGMPDWTP